MTKAERRKRCALRAINKAIELNGGVNGGHAALCRRLKISKQRLNGWRVRGRIPADYVETLAEITGFLPQQVDPYALVLVIEEGTPAGSVKVKKGTAVGKSSFLPGYLKGDDE